MTHFKKLEQCYLFFKYKAVMFEPHMPWKNKYSMVSCVNAAVKPF